MESIVTVVLLRVPTYVNLSQFTDVQRGTIFLWFFMALVITVIIAVRVISGQFDLGREQFTDVANQPGPSHSHENFQHHVLKSQVVVEEDLGTTILVKKGDRLNTMILPVLILFPINFVVGASYAFCLVLYFIVLVPIVLFNLMELHKRFFDHKVFICFFENLWIFATFFWTVNIWATTKFIEPYWMYQLSSTV